jgi:hypothetical protein
MHNVHAELRSAKKLAVKICQQIYQQVSRETLLVKFVSKFTSKVSKETSKMFLKKHRRCFVRNIEDVSTESANVILRIMFSEDEVWSELNPKDGFRKGVVSQHPKTEGSEKSKLARRKRDLTLRAFFHFFQWEFEKSS